jgi:hypothetical protein
MAGCPSKVLPVSRAELSPQSMPMACLLKDRTIEFGMRSVKCGMG